MKKIRTQLQMVFQDPYSSLNPRKHIYEILAQPMLYHHIATGADGGKGDWKSILDMVGLSRTCWAGIPMNFPAARGRESELQRHCP